MFHAVFATSLFVQNLVIELLRYGCIPDRAPASGFALELGRKGTALLGHQTPLYGEHSRLNGCPEALDHYILARVYTVDLLQNDPTSHAGGATGRMTKLLNSDESPTI